ncbi:MAG: acyl-CoA dehydrogenase family protein, partial [Hyphomonadaceae bacterium]
MRFHLSEEQRAIQEALHGALTAALPRERLQAFVDGNIDFEPESWRAIMALGFGGLILSEEVGGSGLELLDAALAVEALAKGAAPGPLIGQLVAGIAIAASDNAEAKARWLAALASGEAVATLAFGGAWAPETWDVEFAEGRATGEVRF